MAKWLCDKNASTQRVFAKRKFFHFSFFVVVYFPVENSRIKLYTCIYTCIYKNQIPRQYTFPPFNTCNGVLN